MSRKKPGWTEPGSVIDRAEGEAAVESRKGTAAANPVLSLAPDAHPSRTRNGGSPAEEDHVPGHRSPAEIEADIAATRDRLAGTLDELTDRLSPRAVLRRANSSVRGTFLAEDGSVRKDRAALTAGGVLAIVGGLVAARKLKR